MPQGRGGSRPPGVCRKEEKRAGSGPAWGAVVGLWVFPRVLDLKEEANLSSRGSGGGSYRSHDGFPPP